MKQVISILTGLFLFSAIAFAQKIEVTGIVYGDMEAKDHELIGANVVEKGNSSNGTITDYNGNFTFKVNPGAILVVSYVGYKTEEISTEEKGYNNIVVVLHEDSQMLDEAIITAPKDDDDD